MLNLIVLTFLVFMVLWLGDFYITLKTVRKRGIRAEANPIMKFYLLRGKLVWLFKALEIGIFFYLLSFLTVIGNTTTPFYILLTYIFIYTLLVANNSRVYFKVMNKESGAFKLIFVAISILMVFFIYMNYLVYSGLMLSYNTLMECQSEYKELNWECYQENTTAPISSIDELEDILNSLNIPIPRP